MIVSSGCACAGAEFVHPATGRGVTLTYPQRYVTPGALPGLVHVCATRGSPGVPTPVQLHVWTPQTARTGHLALSNSQADIVLMEKCLA